MLIDLKNGTERISIREGVCSYLKFIRPRAVVWSDNHGSIGQFLSVSPIESEYRLAIHKDLNDLLYVDFTNKMDEAFLFLQPLLQLFEDGKYLLSFSSASGKEHFIMDKSELSGELAYETHWDVQIAGATYNDEQSIKQFRRKRNMLVRYFSRRDEQSKLLNETTLNFYDGGDCDFIATQPYESINFSRVNFFKSEIENGRRPFAIVARKAMIDGDTLPNDIDFNDHLILGKNFVLDGHHKLLAYRGLNVHPPVLLITQVCLRKDEPPMDLEELRSVLLPWQFDDLVNTRAYFDHLNQART